MDFQVVRENALKYLGYQAPMFEGLTPEISSLLDECIEEIKQIAQPKVIVKRFKLAKDPLRLEESGDEILGQQMEDMLEDCEECILIGCTLGIVMERKIKFYAKVNMTKSTVMDAIQVILYGSFNANFLNKAADDAKNKRSVLSYLRGEHKDGSANRKDMDFCSVIALEIEDKLTHNYTCAGIAFEVRKNEN